MIVTEDGSRRVAIGVEERSARYSGRRQLVDNRAATVRSPVDVPVRVFAEVERRFGGMTARALLGAQFTVVDTSATTIQVLLSDEPLGFGRDATCASVLGKPSVPGLPDEFAHAVLAALVGSTTVGLPAGTLVIDRAGHDEVSSSNAALALAARVLSGALAATLSGDGDVEAAVRAALRPG